MSVGPVAVVGVGLMGASLGLALRTRAGVDPVRGFDPSPESASEAVRLGAVTEMAPTLAAAVAGARAVFVAAPVPSLVDATRAAIAASPSECVVSDLGSTKAGVMRGLDGRERRRFVGGHPICGGETSGPGAARADLFADAPWFLTPPDEIEPDLYARVHRIVAAVGARPTAIGVDDHDRLMAVVSHLPHVLAVALVNEAAATAAEGRDALTAAGPSFRDITRVAGSNPDLWADILVENADALGPALRSSEARVAALAEAVEARDRNRIRSEFAAARAGHDRIGRGSSQARGEPVTLTVPVADRPGALSAITTALGDAGVNIADLALRPGPPGGQGALRVTVTGDRDAERARSALSSAGYPVAEEGETFVS